VPIGEKMGEGTLLQNFDRINQVIKNLTELIKFFVELIFFSIQLKIQLDQVLNHIFSKSTHQTRFNTMVKTPLSPKI
jgi:hypothetical protein